MGKNLFLFLLLLEMETEILIISGFSGLHRFNFGGRINSLNFRHLWYRIPTVNIVRLVMNFFRSDSSSHWFVTGQNVLSLSFNKYGFSFKIIF